MTEAKHSNVVKAERAGLVGVRIKSGSRVLQQDHLDEMRALADTAGVHIVTVFQVPRDSIDPGMVMGKGKAVEIREAMIEMDIHVLLFDDPLEPVQERNLARFFDCKIIDRVELILDIFAKRAMTREAQVQVELAQLKYLLPRLTRMWVHLSRKYGGVGTRGPGETQLEIDRRRVREKIHRLAQKIEDVRTIRRTQRKSRERASILRFSLVGYTNAGKSSLFQRLTSADTLIANQLFCTLDPLSRKVELPGGRSILLTDTVGFIRKLPHFLVDAFRATLEETFEAEYLIHVVDLTATMLPSKMEAVHEVMDELGVDEERVVTVLNKMDCDIEDEALKTALRLYPDAVQISVKTGEGLTELMDRLDRLVSRRFQKCYYFFPMRALGKAESLFKKKAVLDKYYSAEGLFLHVEADSEIQGRLKAHEISTEVWLSSR
jgi:GTP-binding protein HflX